MWTPLKEIFDSRELLFALSHRDIKIRYKQTAIGGGWAIVMPLVMMTVFTLVFARQAKIDTAPIPYPVFVLCGLLPWQFFPASLKGGVESLSRNNRLITKIYFPREVFPLSQIVASAVDFVVASALLGIMMLWYRTPVHPTILFVPVVIAVQILFTAGLSFFLSVGNLFFRDVKYLLDFFLLPWMLATIVFPISNAGGWVGFLLKLNPMAPIVDAYRQTLLLGRLPDPYWFGYAACVAIILAVTGLKFFHETEHQFAEII
jgi:ABC-type polysaccharide/polyol phosphate export permease